MILTEELLAITSHGTLIALDVGSERLRHVSFAEGLKQQICEGSSVCYLQAGEVVFGEAPHLRFGLEVERSGAMYFRRGGNYIRSLPDGSVDLDATLPGEWEKHLLVTKPQAESLLKLISRSWKMPGSDDQLKPQVRTSTNCGLYLAIGSIQVPLNKVPLLIECDGYCVVFEDGWKPVLLLPSSPLVYYVALGNRKYVEMAILSIESVLRCNDSEISFAIFCDFELPSDLSIALSALSQSVNIVRVGSQVGILEAYLYRYRFSDWEKANEYGPILYLDTDVLCTGNLTPLFQDLRCSHRVEAGAENYSPLLERESVGSNLIKLDRLVPEAQFGFNTGVLGFANVKSASLACVLVQEVAIRYADVYGRSAYANWYDQVPANYVAQKVDCVGTGILTKYVTQIMPWRDERGHWASVCGSQSVLSHYWGAGDQRLEAMREHISKLG